MRVVLINAAAADGRAAGKPIIRSLAALCGDVGGTGFGALDGDFISSFISGSVIVRFGFCAAADAGCTSAARCVLDLCVACDGHIAKAAHAAADTGTFLAALCIDYCVAINDHSAFATNEIRSVKRRNSAAADACAIGASLCALDLCVACDGHIAIATRAATDACAAAVALCALDLCVAFDVHSAFAARAAADASTQTAARSGDRTAGNCHIAVTADGLFVTGTAANTGTPTTTVGSDLTARNGHLAVLFVTAADASTVVTTRGSQTASSIGRISLCGAIIILFVLNRQRAAVVGLVMLQTGVAISACQRVVAVQLDVRIAAAGHFHGGFVLIGVVAVFVLFINIDVHIIQSDIGRLVFLCFDGDRVLRACAGDGNVVVRTIFDLSIAVADVFLLVLTNPVPLADEIAAFTSVNTNGAVGDIIRIGKSRKGHAGHHGTGESESCDPLCGNAGRGRCLFLAEKHRNMPQDAHGESAIRDH